MGGQSSGKCENLENGWALQEAHGGAVTHLPPQDLTEIGKLSALLQFPSWECVCSPRVRGTLLPQQLLLELHVLWEKHHGGDPSVGSTRSSGVALVMALMLLGSPRQAASSAGEGCLIVASPVMLPNFSVLRALVHFFCTKRSQLHGNPVLLSWSPFAVEIALPTLPEPVRKCLALHPSLATAQASSFRLVAGCL